MTRLSLVLVLLCLTVRFTLTTTMIHGQTNSSINCHRFHLIGSYYRSVGCVSCHDDLSLKQDSTFKLLFQTDWVSNEDIGTWTVKHKTLFLSSIKTKKTYSFKIKETVNYRRQPSIKLKDQQHKLFSSPRKARVFYKNEPIPEWR